MLFKIFIPLGPLGPLARRPRSQGQNLSIAFFYIFLFPSSSQEQRKELTEKKVGVPVGFPGSLHSHSLAFPCWTATSANKNCTAMSETEESDGSPQGASESACARWRFQAQKHDFLKNSEESLYCYGRNQQ